MPSIQASIELYDSFSQKLSQVDTAINTTIAVMERLHAQMQSAITLQIQAGNIASELQRIKDFIAALGATANAIQLSVNSEQILQQLRTVRQQISGEFASSVIEVRLDAADIVTQSAHIRQQIEAIGSTSIINLVINSAEVLTELTQIRQRIAGISASTVIQVSINATDITTQVAHIRSQLVSIGTLGVISLELNTAEVLAKITQIRHQIATLGSTSVIDIQFNSTDIASRAALIRRRIDAELNGIVARIRIELPASLTAMFTNLQRLVMRLISAMRQIRARSGDAEDLRRALERIAQLERQIADLQSRVNSQINNASKSTSNWLGGLKGIVATYLSLSAAKGFLAASDAVSSINARLAMINDGLRSQYQLQQQVLKVADDTRASYSATANLVTKLGMGTQGLFKTDDDILKFAERFNKSLVISGATAVESESAILQMGQALGSGVLQGDELRSLSETAPALMRILADGLGVARGELKKMGSEGKLTSEMIVKAFEKQSGKIDTMFNQMPMTFGAATTIMKNKFTEWIGTINGVGGPLSRITQMIQDLTTWLSTSAGDQFFSGLSSAISSTVDVIVFLGQGVARVYDFITANWPTIEPIVWGITAALIAWKLATIAVGSASLFTTISTGIMTAAVFLQTVATGGLALAWRGLNAAMKANIFIAIITIVAAVIVWLWKLYQTNDAFAAGWMRTWNTILNFFDQVPIFFVKIGNGIVNMFQWMKVTSLKILQGMINGTVDLINGLVNTLNKIPGVELSTVSHIEFTASAAAEAEAIKQAGEAKVAEMQNSASSRAQAREAKVQKMLNDRASKREAEAAAAAAKTTDNGLPTAGSGFSGSGSGSGAGTPNIDKVNKVEKIEKPVDISKEDLKIMRDVAEMKNIQNFVTLKPTVQVKTGPVSNSVNIDSIVTKITKKLDEQIASTAKGVYS